MYTMFSPSDVSTPRIHHVSSPYNGRHRPAYGTSTARPSENSGPSGRHRSGKRRVGPSLVKPVSVSAVSLGATFALVQTATNTSLADITQANAIVRPAALMMSPQAEEPKAPEPATHSRGSALDARLAPCRGNPGHPGTRSNNTPCTCPGSGPGKSPRRTTQAGRRPESHLECPRHRSDLHLRIRPPLGNLPLRH